MSCHLHHPVRLVPTAAGRGHGRRERETRRALAASKLASAQPANTCRRTNEYIQICTTQQTHAIARKRGRAAGKIQGGVFGENERTDGWMDGGWVVVSVDNFKISSQVPRVRFNFFISAKTRYVSYIHVLPPHINYMFVYVCTYATIELYMYVSYHMLRVKDNNPPVVREKKTYRSQKK